MQPKAIVHKISARYSLVVCLLLIILGGCNAQVEPQVSNASSFNTDSLGTLILAITEANKLASPERERQFIILAEKFAKHKEWRLAQQQLEKIDSATLDNSDYLYFYLISGKVFLETSSLAQAKDLVSSSRLDTLLDQLPIEQQKQLHNARAKIYQRLGDVAASLNEHIILGTLISDQEEHQNNNQIWQQLSLLTPNELETLSANVSNNILKGWFDLAKISKKTQHRIATQQTSIAHWKINNPHHPASSNLPDDLQFLTKILQTKPNHIALLLPLQGKLAPAGEAIRDGFMSAYYSNQDEQQQSPSIRLYDTSSTNINTLYDKAVTDGANLIIGPLVKSRVAALQQKAEKPIPILALNYLNSGQVPQGSGKKSMYQFGLSLEDEAVQVAERAWLEGHRNALILSSKANWSDRAANTFATRWKELGGTIIDQTLFNKSSSYSDIIEQTLHIDRSKQRARALKTLFGRPFEFEPRRRRDVDMIFLLTRSKEGRQIKPTLNFHYASNIPVYATSQIYSSVNSKDKNSDLNGIKLTTLPWVINKDINERVLIENNVIVNPNYERLYALGADSFLLYPRLDQLQLLKDQLLYGTTGKLGMDKDQRITREQVWATIVKGEIRPLRTLTLPSNSTL